MKTKLLFLFSFAITTLAAQQTYNLGWANDGTCVDQQLSIDVGDTVKWIWGDNMPHNIVQLNGDTEPGFGETIYESQGHEYSHTFTTVGAHDYQCSPHPNSMYGTITVTNPPNNLSETVIAVWDFNNGSTLGVFGESFESRITSNKSLGFLKEGSQTSAPDPHSVVCNTRNGFSAGYLQGLDLTADDLVDGKLHLSITYNLIDLPGELQSGTNNNTGEPIFKNAISHMFMKGALNSTAGWVNAAANNQRLTGNHVQGADEGTNLNVTKIVTNNGIQYGGAKLAGTLGSSVEYSETITLGTTMDFIANTNTFWVGSPGQNPDTPFGLTSADPVNQSTTWNETTIENKNDIILKLLQFEIRTGDGSIIVDQVKISTGAYENTVESGDPVVFDSPTWAGDWTLDPTEGALQVGWNTDYVGGWWTSDANVPTLRSCLFDDVFSFNTDGTFTIQNQGSTWIEPWQNIDLDADGDVDDDDEGCGTPVAPHDGSNAATYTYDGSSVTVNGNGAYVGLAKVHNNGEDGNSGGSVTYDIYDITDNFMHLRIKYATPDQVANGPDPDRTWQFRLRRVGTVPATTNVTFAVNTANITVLPDGMYLGGGIFGNAQAHAMSDSDGDGTWEVTVPITEGTDGNYIFLNGPTFADDWGAKEQLGGQSCADAGSYNDRILYLVGASDYTLQHCFGSCESDGTCPVADPVPEACAPVPSQLAADVIPVFSDAYANNIVTNTDPFWGQTTDASVIQIGPNSECNVLKYAGLTYQGMDYTNSDVTAMDFVHLDYFTFDSTDIRFFLIGDGENPYNIGTELGGITTGQWVSVDIPLTHYTSVNLANVYQFKTEGNGNVFLDNLYFYKESTAGLNDSAISEFTYYPNPVNDQLTISAQSNVKDITVFNLLGQVVSRQSPNTKDCLVDMAAMQTGAYFVQISIGSTVEMVRVLKQ